MQKWSENIVINNEEIDQQHKSVIEICSNIAEAIESNSEQELFKLLANLMV